MEQPCPNCGVPSDAGFFDDSSIQAAPEPGDEKVLARYELHRNYCGVLMYFAQLAEPLQPVPANKNDSATLETPGYEWLIRCSDAPRDPYLSFDYIINPWGLSGFPINLRLEEGALVELVVRNKGSDGHLAKVGGRILGRYWYNPIYGGAPNAL